jgi:hypothetical protein
VHKWDGVVQFGRVHAKKQQAIAKQLPIHFGKLRIILTKQ